jgi:hypothetical protein
MESFDQHIGETLLAKERELLEISRQRYAHLEDKVARRDLEIEALQTKIRHLSDTISGNLKMIE